MKKWSKNVLLSCKVCGETKYPTQEEAEDMKTIPCIDVECEGFMLSQEPPEDTADDEEA